MLGFTQPIRAIIIGGSGGVGNAFVQMLAQAPEVTQVWATSRQPLVQDNPAERIRWMSLNITSEASLASFAEKLAEESFQPNLILNCSGLLHTPSGLGPEKSWRHLNMETMEEVFRLNCFGVALLGKHLIPLMPRNERALFGSFSARVGSIGDNRLGGVVQLSCL